MPRNTDFRSETLEGRLFFSIAKLLHLTAALPDYGAPTGAASGNVAVFAGFVPAPSGQGGSLPATADVEFYDTQTHASTRGKLSVARYYLAATSVGAEAIFAGGLIPGQAQADPGTGSTAVDIFNGTSGRWSTASLSQGRYSLAATTVGNLSLFAGGLVPGAAQAPSAVVDVRNDASGHWSTAALAQARYGLAATSTGNLALFAGGQTSSGYSGVVDIYNSSTGQWSTAALSQARSGLAAVSVGNLAIFAGGVTQAGASRVVDIFDANTLQWTATTLPDNAGQAIAVLDHYMIFAGFNTVADVYDVNTNQWSTLTLSKSRSNLAAVTVHGHAVFAGGIVGPGLPDNTVDDFSIDNTPPTVTVSPLVTLKKSLKTYTFSVTYYDAAGVDVTTLADNDVVVTGPNGFARNATFVSQTSGKHGTTRVVTYTVAGPGSRFDSADNGVYTLHLQNGQVADLNGNGVVGRPIGHFSVAVGSAGSQATPALQRVAAACSKPKRNFDVAPHGWPFAF